MTVGVVRDLFGSLNATLGLAFFVLVTVWAVMQLCVRNTISSRLHALGIGTRSRPAILTVNRYADWLRRENITTERALVALTFVDNGWDSGCE